MTVRAENIKMPAVGIGVLSATSGTCSKKGQQLIIELDRPSDEQLIEEGEQSQKKPGGIRVPAEAYRYSTS